MLSKALRASNNLISFRYGESGNTTTATIPTSIGIGDVMVLYNLALNSSGFPSATVPSGFTQVATEQTTGAVASAPRTYVMSYKILDASDRGRVLTLMTGNNSTRFVFAIFKAGATSVSVGSVLRFAGDTEPPANSITASAVGSLEKTISVASFRGQAGMVYTFNPLGGTIEFDADLLIAYKVQNYASQNISIDLNDGGTGNQYCGFYLRVLQ